MHSSLHDVLTAAHHAERIRAAERHALFAARDEAIRHARRRRSGRAGHPLLVLVGRRARRIGA